MIDLLGFAGSGLIILSLTMKSIVRLRVVGLAGAAIFVSYGVLLGAWPVVVTNCITLSIHLFRLRGMLTEQAKLQPRHEPPLLRPAPVLVYHSGTNRMRPATRR